ncbi:YolD-like family protein [Evansella tamaricis]|uniref:YolD-like family protein n=1 Tax=Evansella tamaricis TaxID=2069301 RepID=A0ABS6JBI7_9BACI|nr:YolD-like family protein [Evansella tamaricis]MBU9711043.1 YolD-like family protein [Evansella tamaricis]
MNRDRGTIKWTAMMLPEHVAMLRDLEYRQRKQPKPEVDLQQLEEYEFIIAESLEYQNDLTFKYWKNGFYEKFTGRVQFVDPVTKRLHVINDQDEIEYIPIENITSII